jgi:hypothetical protein
MPVGRAGKVSTYNYNMIYFVFHEEPAVALTSFFRYNSVFSYAWGVCGSFWGAKGGSFFWGGGHLGEIGQF